MSNYCPNKVVVNRKMPVDRRRFIKTLSKGTVVLGAAAIGCDNYTQGQSDRNVYGDPVLLELSDGRIVIQDPIAILPLAYVSRSLREIYVAYESRMSVSVLVAAHISVSSGLWRIPLLGDDLGVPIDAGDPEREFSEHDISEWDPESSPEEGDYRVQVGSGEIESVKLDCVPVLPGKGWVSGGPWDTSKCNSSGAGLCREVFTKIGSGMKHEFKSYRTCAKEGQPVEFLSWICSEV